MEEKNPNPCTRSASSSCMLEKNKATTTKPPKEQLNCPRCKSSNTKFCYYNNYSLTQPRYFCKSCRRYWTEGGSLRNVPVGGGSRKNRKSATTLMSSSASASSSSSSHDHYFHTHNPKLPNHPSSQFSTQNPSGRDLNLAFSVPPNMSHNYVQLPKVVENNVNNNNHDCGIGFRGLSSFIPNLMPNSNNAANLGITNGPYPTGFSLAHDHEFKPSNLGINSVDGLGDGRNLVAFQELNQNSAAPNESDHQNERQQRNISTGYWSGMLGGGSL